MVKQGTTHRLAAPENLFIVIVDAYGVTDPQMLKSSDIKRPNDVD